MQVENITQIIMWDIKWGNTLCLVVLVGHVWVVGLMGILIFFFMFFLVCSSFHSEHVLFFEFRF